MRCGFPDCSGDEFASEEITGIITGPCGLARLSIIAANCVFRGTSRARRPKVALDLTSVAGLTCFCRLLAAERRWQYST